MSGLAVLSEWQEKNFNISLRRHTFHTVSNANLFDHLFCMLSTFVPVTFKTVPPTQSWVRSLAFKTTDQTNEKIKQLFLNLWVMPVLETRLMRLLLRWYKKLSRWWVLKECSNRVRWYFLFRKLTREFRTFISLKNLQWCYLFGWELWPRRNPDGFVCTQSFPVWRRDSN